MTIISLGGRYQVERKLSEGTFGETYLAKDIHRNSHPLCVVKKLKPQSPSVFPVSERLFYTEAKILEKLGEHPQIPRLLADFTENQGFYLVQEYIDGEELAKEMPTYNGQIWDEAKVTRLVLDILEILVFVQRYNVIHRDIKPANLMRRRQDGKLVMIDFGAVKEVTTQMANLPPGAPGTILIGTPGYMPYEQEKGQPSFASDIYAVGMIAIEALTGVFPHTLQRDSQTLELIWNRTVVSPRFAAIIDNMVHFHPQHRYQTAAQAIQAIVPNTIISTPPTVPVVPVKNQTLAIVISSLVALIVGLGLATMYYQANQNQQPQQNEGIW
ncbi:MAG TPA: serine/threonine protein kinase [Oscillatoriaceae cyanobacterium M33_DOE_052]|uniref:non-specific serine/threonine protein kinase n=1 Tax=Planktothricoides sp. SpSt-374 TaxID=2282167 RepID=A0A7C3VFY0_9CYAN|nr:serine/threonine protein kinase [Oscillatoriaceae cyanobacterium M33_DOE_052]